MKALRKMLIVFLALAVCLLSGAVGEEPNGCVFTDALGREVYVNNPQRVAIASGSLAECWLLAGGQIHAVTRDAWERNLDLPEETVDLGSLKEPSLEMILAEKIDFLMLMASQKKHLAMTETLDRMGVNYACFDVEDFGDYLSLLELFTDITGRKDLYAANGTALLPRMEAALERGKLDEPAKILILRAATGRIKALDSTSMAGAMFAEFGCENMADSDTGLLSELSLEAIVREDPDYIFVSCMGDVDEAVAMLEGSFASNPVWNSLQAVQNGRCFYLEKELFHYKPNARWGESYEKIAEMLAQD